MKVYGGSIHRQHSWPDPDPDKPWVNQCRGIVAARSRAEVRRILNEQYRANFSVGDLRNHWEETGNDAEIATALAEPGVLFIASMQGPRGETFLRVDGG